MIESIAHTTDFSNAGQIAFAHALRLAMEFRCRLDLLHVRDPADANGWNKFPRVRETLERWGKLPPNSSTSDVAEKLGVKVQKIEIREEDAVTGLTTYLAEHRPDLLVMATHGRAGLSRWVTGSVSTQTAAETHIPAMLFGPAAKPFVDQATGDLELRKVLAPVDHHPSPSVAFQRPIPVLAALGATIDFMHVGQAAPEVTDAAGKPAPVRLVEGDVVDAILAEASAADLLVMLTAGRQGFLDFLQGSTTERIVSKVERPVLTLHPY